MWAGPAHDVVHHLKHGVFVLVAPALAMGYLSDRAFRGDGLLVLALAEVIRYGADAPQVARRLHAMLDELQSTLPAERQAAIAGQRSLLEAAVSATLPDPFAAVASAADREGLG